MEIKQICVIGLGYVGLPTAAVFASRGIKVTGVDVNPKTVETINAGKPHIVEPDLDMVLHGAVSKGWMRASLTPCAADAFIIAVPTPFDAARKPDLSYLESATKAVAKVLQPGNLVIVESTVPVGATNAVCGWIASERPDLHLPKLEDPKAPHDICVAHSPERVLPGQVLLELVRNDRVIGGIGHDCAEHTAFLYRHVVEGELHLTDAMTAELVKLSENAYRDVNIAFANEIANVAEPLGIDAREVIQLANHHPRVNVLSPGPGVGGHCIAVDPWFIVSTAPERTPLIQAARHVNDGRPKVIAKQTADLENVKSGAPIACLGLSYKADIDDVRESPSITTIVELRRLVDNEILVSEPNLDTLPADLQGLSNIEFCEASEAIARSGSVLLLTDHRPYREMTTSLFNDKNVLDTRGIWRSLK